MKIFLTNEALKKHFKNDFELANQAIRLAKQYVRAGHEFTVDQLLAEIRRHPQGLPDDDEEENVG